MGFLERKPEEALNTFIQWLLLHLDILRGFVSLEFVLLHQLLKHVKLRAEKLD